MDIKAKMNAGGFRKKLHNLKNLNRMFEDLPGHTAFFLQDELVNKELDYGYDGDHIGRPSGRLAGGVTVQVRPYYGSWKMNGDGESPYAEDVSNWAQRKYGTTPKQHLLDRITQEVYQTIADEWKRAVNIIERGGNYTYDNPYYTAL